MPPCRWGSVMSAGSAEEGQGAPQLPQPPAAVLVGGQPLTLMSTDSVSLPPKPSVTVSVTVYLPLLP